jgi:hypothetical protein
MDAPVLGTAFMLTCLSTIGLFFFIKASVKDRTQTVKLIAELEADSLLEQLKDYFRNRAYRLAALDAAENQLTFEGLVRPSWFMAIFLSFLAACGCLSLGLALSMVFSQSGELFLWLGLLSPLAGVFYWQKAKRPERVSIQLEWVVNEDQKTESAIAVTGHRDELAVLQRTLGLRIEQ